MSVATVMMGTEEENESYDQIEWRCWTAEMKEEFLIRLLEAKEKLDSVVEIFSREGVEPRAVDLREAHIEINGAGARLARVNHIIVQSRKLKQVG